MKIKKLKEYECGQNDDERHDGNVMVVFVVVSRAGKSRWFAIGIKMLACSSAQCFLAKYVGYRMEQLLFSYLRFSPIHCRPKKEIKQLVGKGVFSK